MNRYVPGGAGGWVAGGWGAHRVTHKIVKKCVTLKLSFTIVVGYTGAKKGSCFKFLRVPAYLMQYDLLSILTPFLLKSPQKWECRPKKNKSDEGGLWGGPKNGILDQISYFTPYCVDFGAILHIFLWSKNPFV